MRVERDVVKKYQEKKGVSNTGSEIGLSGFIAISLFMFEDEINAVSVSYSVVKAGYRPVYFVQFRSL